MSIRFLFSLALVALLSHGPACEAALIIGVDEFGNGLSTIGRGTLRPDPGPGGLPSVLTYDLPFNETFGDVEIFGPNGFDGLIRFNGDSTLVFYSAPHSGVPPTLADTPTPPLASYPPPNRVMGPEFDAGGGLAVAIYTPFAGQPGYNPDIQPTYLIISTLGTPAPPSLFMGATAALAGAGYCGYARAGRKPGGWRFRTARRAGRAAG
jgi:hypothetical protein